MKVKEIVKTSYYATLAELARNHQKISECWNWTSLTDSAQI